MSLDNDVTLEGGALVKQRLKYHYYSAAFDMGKVEWTGAWHNHYPEWKEGIKWLVAKR